MGTSVEDGCRESSRPPNYWWRASSSDRLITAPHVQVIQAVIVLDRGVEIAAASVLLQEGVEVGEQVSVTLIAHTATLLGRSHCVNVSDCGHYLPFGITSPLC
jgi:hypothetical protein